MVKIRPFKGKLNIPDSSSSPNAETSSKDAKKEASHAEVNIVSLYF